MDVYVCPACSAVVSCSRRDAHESAWCPARVKEEGEESSEDERPAGVGGARSLLTPLCEATTTVTFSSMPSLSVSLLQTDIWGPADTGGALWYADRVMSEYIAAGALDIALSQSLPDSKDLCRMPSAAAGVGSSLSSGPRPSRGLALALGCGGAPLSALVAAAVGWKVIMTDLDVCLEQAQQNVTSNLNIVRSTRSDLGLADLPDSLEEMTVMELWFGDDAALKKALSDWTIQSLADPGNQSSGPLVVICSDCIWKPELHLLLIKTIISALRECPAGAGVSLVAFQRRSPTNEALFMKRLKEAEVLCIENVDIADVLGIVHWPPQAQSKNVDLVHEFQMLRLSLP